MEWIEGKPSEEGMYWLYDMVNGVLFGMVVEDETELYYYVMGCDMGLPIDQLSHFIRAKPPMPPIGSIRLNLEV